MTFKMTFRQMILRALLAGALLIAPAGLGVSRVSADDDDSELAKHMEQIQDDLKALKKSLKAPEQNAASIELVGKVQAAAVASKALAPAKAAQVPEAERAAFVAGYRKEMAAFIGELLKIELALLDNDNAKAEELQKGLSKIEDDGHEKYAD